MKEDPASAKKFNLVHYFNTFSFANAQVVSLEDLKFRFAETPEHLNFDISPKSLSELERTDYEFYNYFKFSKLVAHSFVDTLDSGHEHDYQTWQYSLTQNKKAT